MCLMELQMQTHLLIKCCLDCMILLSIVLFLGLGQKFLISIIFLLREMSCDRLIFFLCFSLLVRKN